jgi:hypothetical protein
MVRVSIERACFSILVSISRSMSATLKFISALISENWTVEFCDEVEINRRRFGSLSSVLQGGQLSSKPQVLVPAPPSLMSPMEDKEVEVESSNGLFLVPDKPDAVELAGPSHSDFSLVRAPSSDVSMMETMTETTSVTKVSKISCQILSMAFKPVSTRWVLCMWLRMRAASVGAIAADAAGEISERTEDISLYFSSSLPSLCSAAVSWATVLEKLQMEDRKNQKELENLDS